MLTPEQVRSFHELGFLNYGPVLTDAQIAELRAALDRVLAGRSTGQAEQIANLSGGDRVVTQVVNIWEAEPTFRAHLSSPAIVPLVAQLMDTDTVRVWHDQIQIKPPRIGGPTIWHQDHPYWPIIQPADLVSAWVALEDAVIENGAMWMVPGSHRWGPYNGPDGDGTIGLADDELSPAHDPARVPADALVEIVPCEVAAGSVVFHHCLTWHGAPPNRSNRDRPAIAVHYMPGHTRYEPQGRTHVVAHHVQVAPGQILTGAHFPTVMENGQMLAFSGEPQ